MKNNENNEYSEVIKIINEKKSQILRHLTSYYIDNHVTEKFNHHDNKHENEQEHVIYITDIIFNKINSDDYLTNIIKR